MSCWAKLGPPPPPSVSAERPASYQQNVLVGAEGSARVLERPCGDADGPPRGRRVPQHVCAPRRGALPAPRGSWGRSALQGVLLVVQEEDVVPRVAAPPPPRTSLRLLSPGPGRWSLDRGRPPGPEPAPRRSRRSRHGRRHRRRGGPGNSGGARCSPGYAADAQGSPPARAVACQRGPPQGSCPRRPGGRAPPRGSSGAARRSLRHPPPGRGAPRGARPRPWTQRRSSHRQSQGWRPGSRWRSAPRPQTRPGGGPGRSSRCSSLGSAREATPERRPPLQAREEPSGSMPSRSPS